MFHQHHYNGDDSFFDRPACNINSSILDIGTRKSIQQHNGQKTCNEISLMDQHMPGQFDLPNVPNVRSNRNDEKFFFFVSLYETSMNREDQVKNSFLLDLVPPVIRLYLLKS